MSLNFAALLPYVDMFVQGAWVTFTISLLSIASSFALALPLVLTRVSPNRVLSTFAKFYVHLFRNTPLLVLLFVIYFGLGSAGIIVSSYVSGWIALTLNSAAYTTEIYRGGINGVDPGQREASAALGFSTLQTWRYFVLPQAIRFAFYPLGNQIVATVLGSALVMVVAAPDITYASLTVGSYTFRYFEAFIAAGLVYIVLVQVINYGWRSLGRVALPKHAEAMAR
ncbi:MAG: amino acid ABC transporter permease [Chloroflexota bacterium]